MSRRIVAWLVTLPLAVAGSQAAHWLAYRLASPDGEERAHALASTGHGYLAYAPLALAIAVVVVLAALAGEVRQLAARSGRGASRPSALGFVVLAPAIFVCQEHLERLVESGSFPWGAAWQPTFAIGLAVQIPFALLGYAVARLLLRAARAIAVALTPAARPRRAVAVRGRPPRRVSTPRLPVLALGYGSRGPPLPALR